MAVKPHKEQAATAEHVRKILADSAFLKETGGKNLQDALLTALRAAGARSGEKDQ